MWLWAVLTILIRSACSHDVPAHSQTTSIQPARPTGFEYQLATRTSSSHNFITRPDFQAKRWQVNVYDADAVTPGYWFVAPYFDIDEIPANKWIGPHIYDNKGELVWSGAPSFSYQNVLDFKKSGDGLSLIHPIANTAITLHQNYTVDQEIDMFRQQPPEWAMPFVKALYHQKVNMHEFNIVENENRALIATNIWGENITEAESMAISFNGFCRVKWEGFKEIDLETHRTIFEWSSHGHIDLAESTYERQWPDGTDACNAEDLSGWDFL